MIKSHKIRPIWPFLFTVFLISVIPRAVSAQGSIAYIDEHNRFILNGEPFFPIGLYLYLQGGQSYPDTDELNDIANSPFDTLIHYNTAVTDDTQNNAFLSALQERGLKLIFSLFVEGCNINGVDPPNTVCQIPYTISQFRTYIEQKVTAFREHPAIIAWYLNDEICPVCLDWLEAGYDEIQKWDVDHPVWSVHWNTDWLIQEAHTTDIVGVDSYPIPDNPITWVLQRADEANEAGKPLWFVPQIFGWTDKRPPTWEEMRAMTYLAVNHGAKGLIYYSYSSIVNDPDYDTRWPQIKEIASEIDQLKPVILSIDPTNDNDITCDNSDIDFKLMKQGTTYYLCAVNTKVDSGGEPVENNGVSFQVNLANKPSEFNTLFENDRQVSVINGNVTDDFGVYEVHLYQWEDPGTVSTVGGGGGGGGCFIATATFDPQVIPMTHK